MRIGLVSFGLEERNERLQPWHYLFEAAHALARSGHDVHLISDGYPRLPREETVAGLPMVRLASLQDWPWYGNLRVVQAVTDLRPDVLLWHLGLTGFLRSSTLKRFSVPVVGIFTSPVYRPRELLRLGFLRLLRGYRLSVIHLLGLFVPGMLIRRALDRQLIEQLVVECETTRARLIQRGAPGDRIHVIRPDIDPLWFETMILPTERIHVRDALGFSSETFVVGFFGSPALLRGLPTLLKAVAMAQEREPRVRLLILSRRRDDELHAEQKAVERLMVQLEAGEWTHVVTGFLSQRRLIQTIAACDVVTLPFEVTPSDVPISVLEAMAMGIPVITTQVVCLPELAPEGSGLCLPPGDSTALAEGILELANDTEMRQRLSKAGRRRAISWGARDTSDDMWNRLLGGTPLDGKG